MDLYLDTTLSGLVKIFKLLKFKVVENDNYFSATRKTPQGRFHAMFTPLPESHGCKPMVTGFTKLKLDKNHQDNFFKRLRRISGRLRQYGKKTNFPTN